MFVRKLMQHFLILHYIHKFTAQATRVSNTDRYLCFRGSATIGNRMLPWSLEIHTSSGDGFYPCDIQITNFLPILKKKYLNKNLKK
jgi:hypothetical protein